MFLVGIEEKLSILALIGFRRLNMQLHKVLKPIKTYNVQEDHSHMINHLTSQRNRIQMITSRLQSLFREILSTRA
jgi:hypothetical protein